MGGNRDVALALLMAGADINAQDRDGKTALMIGIINAHQPLVELLLKRNANIKVKNEVNSFCAFTLCMLGNFYALLLSYADCF